MDCLQSPSIHTHTYTMQHIDIDSFLTLGPPQPNNPHNTQYQYSIQQSPPYPYDQFQQQDDEQQQQILPDSLQMMQTKSKGRNSTLYSQVQNSAPKRKHGKQATAKYRQKRKHYQQQLQQSVKQLQIQIGQKDKQIQKVKDQILNKLESSMKAVNNTQNSQIFTQLANYVNKSSGEEEVVDIDKVNLLLNTLKYRIGASGRERQAKIQYSFKNIVNTLFPGLARYFLVTATNKQDIFRKESESGSGNSGWTKQFIQKLELTQQQVQQIREKSPKLQDMHEDTLKKIQTLHKIKLIMRDKALQIDSTEDDFRDIMSTLQCAHWTLFCEKYKYRKDIALDGRFRAGRDIPEIEQEMEEVLRGRMGTKRSH